MSAMLITVQAIGPHDEQNEPVGLTEKLILARWNALREDSVQLRHVLDELENVGALEHLPVDEESGNDVALLDLVDGPTTVADLADDELQTVHDEIGEVLVAAVTADEIVEIVHPATDAHGNPAVAPLLFNMIESHGDVPENYGGLLVLAVARLFESPVTEEEMAAYVRGEDYLVD